MAALYHICFWFGFQWYGSASIKAVYQDIAATVAIMAVAASLFPAQDVELKPETLSAIHLNMNVGTLHIFLSFALSSLNPGWIRAAQSRL